MKVERVKIKIKCDASGCNNASEYMIVNKKFIFDGNIYLCSTCANELYSELGKFMTPKSIEPIYKKRGKNE